MTSWGDKLAGMEWEGMLSPTQCGGLREGRTWNL